jgi:hypothetical protein
MPNSSATRERRRIQRQRPVHNGVLNLPDLHLRDHGVFMARGMRINRPLPLTTTFGLAIPSAWETITAFR